MKLESDPTWELKPFDLHGGRFHKLTKKDDNGCD